MSQQRAGSVADPAEIAGRYQVVQRLGAGAFGTVYKAKDKLLGRMVAIKTIRLEGLAASATSLDELTDRFKREARVSAQLKHPNIVTIYDIGEADGLSYLAMEFIDGVGLDKVIAAEGRLPVERAALLGAQVADALDFAHKGGVIHRDIKPANIMIEPGDRVKVTDFGIAKVTDSAEHLTATGSLLGTPSYMSPEQARGGTLDGRSDLFSVGCVLYEMVAGQKAFRGDSITGLIFKIITEDPPPLRELDPQVPEELVRIINKAFAKSPEARYQSGKEMASDLLGLTRAGSSPTLRQMEMPTAPGVPIPVSPPTAVGSPTISSPPTVATPPTRTAPPPSPAAAATVQPAPVLRPAPAVAARPVPPRRSGLGLLLVLAVAGVMFLGIAVGVAWYVLRPKPAPSAVGASIEGAGSAAAVAPAPTPVSAPPAPEAMGAVPENAPAAEAATSAAPQAAREAVAAPAGGSSRAAAAPQPATTRAPAAPPEAAAADTSFLDDEPAEGVDGTEAGRRLAEGYRSEQSGRSGTSFGPAGRFKARERSPRNLLPAERPAVAALRHVMNAEEAFYRKEGRYGTLQDLATAQILFLDVPHQVRNFLRKNYRFELALEKDGYRLTAMPASPGLRPFVGDDSGFIRAGLE